MDKGRVHDGEVWSFTCGYKAQGVLKIVGGAKTRAELSREHRCKPDLLTRRQRRFLEDANSLFEGAGPTTRRRRAAGECAA